MEVTDWNDDLAPTPSPRKSDRLFRGDLPDGMNNACLNLKGRGSDSIAYVVGYRRGAERLVQYVVDNQRDQDFLVYPIIFLYRHHIELTLKRIIGRSPFLLERPLTDVEKKHLGEHRLDWLWQDLKPILAAIIELAGWSPLDSADVEGVDDYIRQLSALDPGSFSFRYWHSKKGTPSLPENLRHINLRHFGDMMERLTDYLDSIDAGTSHLIETKAEAETAWRDAMVQEMDYDYED